MRAGSSSSSGGGGGEDGGGSGGGGAGGATAGAGRRGRSRQRSRRRRLSANCPGSDKMSPGMKKKVDCFSPMLCHCKVACTNSTISLMFGCKVGGNIWSAAEREVLTWGGGVTAGASGSVLQTVETEVRNISLKLNFIFVTLNVL